MSEKLNPRLAEAVQYAIRLHGLDARKGTQIPVLSHLFAVCALVQQDGGSEDEAIAALLHDALEDKPEQTSAIEMGERFGTRVLALIQIATDTPPDYSGGEKPPWKQRKVKYIQHIRETSASDLRVTVADKVDNARALLADYRKIGEALWSRFNAGKEDQLWYYQAVLDAVRAVGFAGYLVDELDRVIGELQILARR